MKEIFKVLCESPRESGGARIKIIKSFIISKLRNYSYDVIEKNYPFTGWKLLKEPDFSFLEPINKKIRCIPVVWSGSADGEIVGKVSSNFNTIKTFEAYPWQLYSVLDYENDEILANLMTRPDMVWAQPLDDSTTKLPYLILDIEACKLLNAWIVDKKEIKVKLTVKSKYLPDKIISNVIAVSNLKQSHTLISAHYDSMFNTVGAHDNASGVVTLLKLAELFSDKNINKYLNFIFFDAEEWNKYGSYCYVNELKQQNKLKDIKLLINIDSVGVGDNIYILVSPELESFVSKIINKIKNSIKIDIDLTVKKEFQQFDSWPFMKNGIPVIHIGTRGTPNFAFFHHPKDNLSNINYYLIEKVINFLENFINSLLQSY